ncbi:MAG: hypothetical protein QXR44_06105 [Thermoproteota archaeon]
MPTAMESIEKEYWLEVELQHPKGWSLGAESGVATKGFFRIDSRSSVKIELKWEKQTLEKRVSRKVQPVVIINRFIESYAKQFKKKPEVRDKGKTVVCGHNAYFTKWKNDTEVVTLSWICDDENKVFLVNYYLEPGEEWNKVADWLIPGIKCHTLENFWKYRLFGVEFKIPKEYKLFYRKLALGRPLMVFKSGNKILMLYWCYFARELLSKYKNLIEWSMREIPKEAKNIIKGFNIKKLKSDENGILTLEEKKRAGFLLSKIFTKVVKIWYDSSSNKIFVIGYLGPEGGLGDLKNLKESISFQIDWEG